MAETIAHEDRPYLYHSGELPPEDRAGFEGHLNDCAECRTAIENLRWAAGLAQAAAIAPEPALTRGALRRALGAPTPSWNWSDWARTSGMGFGLAFAAGLFLFRASPPPTDALSWRSELSTEISELDGRLERLDTDLTLEAWNTEFDEGLDELSRSRQDLQSQLAKPEGV